MIIKKIMGEEKEVLSLLKNQVKFKTEKVNKLRRKLTMGSITKISDLILARAKGGP